MGQDNTECPFSAKLHFWVKSAKKHLFLAKTTKSRNELSVYDVQAFSVMFCFFFLSLSLLNTGALVSFQNVFFLRSTEDFKIKTWNYGSCFKIPGWLYDFVSCMSRAARWAHTTLIRSFKALDKIAFWIRFKVKGTVKNNNNNNKSWLPAFR